MDHFYDGQIRKFLTQFMRVLSNFYVETGKGKDGNVNLKQVPVVYGDLTRQVANILKNNSENTLLSAPKIATYITGLNYDRARLQNPYHIEKQHFNTRDFDENTGEYTTNIGEGYTVEKVMPSPFRLTVNADIFSTNTDMKLQILEQILYLFNPDLEIQKSDNYIDWATLSQIELGDIIFSSRTIPAGVDSEIDVATISFSMPIWLSPPVRISKLGVIQKIIMSIYDDNGNIDQGLIDGSLMTKQYVTPGNFSLLFTNGNQLRLLGNTGSYTGAHESSSIAPHEVHGDPINWKVLLDQYGKITNGISQIKLKQESGNEIVGTVSLSGVDDSIMLFNVDQDTLLISDDNRLNPVNKIINPLTYDPASTTVTDGTRFLLINAVRSSQNTANPDFWRDLDANANDIVEYNQTNDQWNVVFDSTDFDSSQMFVANSNTGITYKWDGEKWVKAFEGIYSAGNWSLVI